MYIKYKNRKIYSKKEHTYMTLEQLALRLRNGEEVRVLDKQTKLDITGEVLAGYIAKYAKNSEQVSNFIKAMQ